MFGPRLFISSHRYSVRHCYSPTDDFNLTYKPHIPSIFIHDEFTPELVGNFLQRQKDIVRKTKTDPEYYEVDPRALLILDD